MKRLPFILLFLLAALPGFSQVKLQNAKLQNAKLGQPVASGGGGGGGDTLTIITAQSIGTGTRNDVTGNVGVLFDVGASPITITQLGRWVISGNSQTHTLILTDSSCNVLASCTVNCSGATAGQYVYGSITATTLSAGTTYRIMSAETSGGDLWYDQDTVTISGALTAAQAAHNISGGCGVGAGGESYVPVNAKYH